MQEVSIPLSILLLTLALNGCGGGDPADVPAAAARSPQAVSLTGSVATFSGVRNNYAISKSGNTYTVTDKVGSDGVFTSASVGSLKFTDMSVNLGIGDKSGTIASADLKSLIELYVAFFNRMPDADGLSYWIDQFRGGLSMDQIAASFYASAIQYSSLTGYSATMTNSDFVKVIYKNVLGRSGTTAPPDADVQYWSDQLASGRASTGSLVRTMLAAAHGYSGDATWSWVANLLDNKNAVANYFAVQQGLNYANANDSITRTTAIAAAVTSTDMSAAMNLIGTTDPAFSLVTGYIYYKRNRGLVPGTATLNGGTLNLDGQSLPGVYVTASGNNNNCLGGGGSVFTACANPNYLPNTLLLCGPDPVTKAPGTLLYVLFNTPDARRSNSNPSSLLAAVQTETSYLGSTVWTDCSGTFHTAWIRNAPNTNYYLWPDVFSTYSPAYVSGLLNGMPVFATPTAGTDYHAYVALRSGTGVFEVWH